VAPTPLDDGLRRLLDTLPEQLPEEGLGALSHKRYWADVQRPRVDAGALFRKFCGRFQQLTPGAMDVGAEPGASEAVLALHQTVTMALPMRGNVQVRVAELGPASLTLQTWPGHPLAGAVRFTFAERGPATAGGAARPFRFEVEVFDRAADAFDWLAMTLVGGRLQEANWEQIVRTIAEESGGEAPAGVERAAETLEGEAAERVERWLASSRWTRKRASNADALGVRHEDTADRQEAGPPAARERLGPGAGGGPAAVRRGAASGSAKASGGAVRAVLAAPPAGSGCARTSGRTCRSPCARRGG
jgi:NADH dehydrogenase